MNGMKENFLIVGLGLLGSSYAAVLSGRGYEVGAIDVDAGALDYAEKQGWIRHGQQVPTEAYVRRFDCIVFALYPHVLVDWIASYRSFFRPGTLLTDVTGVKGCVVGRVQAMLPPGVEFVGAHPMAGREVSGVRNASADLFCGANYLVTPTPQNTEAAIRRCEELGCLLGCSHISRLTPQQHDEMIGFLSQLPHVLAVALMTCRDTEHLAAYTGDSFRDLTRIGKINDGMWSELFLDNREALLAEMDRFLEKFTELKEALENRDAETLRRLMRLSTERRSRFDRSEEPEKKG